MIYRRLLILITLIVLFSCTGKHEDFQTNQATGLKYKFFRKNENAQQPKADDILVLDMSYRTEDDSVLFDTKDISQDFRMKMGRDRYEGEALTTHFQ